MADDGLEALRAKRMQELQGQHAAMNPDKQKQQQQQQERQEEMMNSILSQILDQNARARLNSIALVKPDKAKQVERILISMAQRGQLAEKIPSDCDIDVHPIFDTHLSELSRALVLYYKAIIQMTDAQLVGFLEEVSGKAQKTKVKFERRRVMDSDSDSD